LLRRSPDIVAYLRCEERLPDPKLQAAIDRLCTRVLGN
jgi:hypothetical protein